MPSVEKIFQLIKIIYISWLRVDRCFKIIRSFYLLPLDGFARVLQKINTRVPTLGSHTPLESHPILKIARRIYSRRIVFHNCAINHIYVATLCQSLIKFAIYQEIFIFTRQNNKSFHPREGNIFLNYCQQFLNYREEYSVIFSRQRKEMARY